MILIIGVIGSVAEYDASDELWQPIGAGSDSTIYLLRLNRPGFLGGSNS
ncbi:TPA: hypothetical protein NIC12_006461 [Pseudomonas aeruginosa]|nr:hypothetical protein [Pseudomonas aeruginosa]HCF3508253.1 hypothetical protein [Pseudomonas aeruginosa]